MGTRERRARAVMFTEGTAVLARVGDHIDSEWVRAVVVVVGWYAGTYRVRVGRRLHWVSVTQVRQASEDAER